jgi:DtxR family Mn-dependent transcriptional regulator
MILEILLKILTVIPSECRRTNLKIDKQLLSELAENQKGICVGVKDTSSEFLKYLDKQGIALGTIIEVVSKESFDLSVK